MYLLDTDICIEFLRGRLPKPWSEQIKSSTKSDYFLSMIAASELFYGASRSSLPNQAKEKVRQLCARFRILPIDFQAAEVYGDIRAALAKAGTPIGPNDLFIAAIAIANNLTLVTSNVAEFSRVPNLQILNWRTP